MIRCFCPRCTREDRREAFGAYQGALLGEERRPTVSEESDDQVVTPFRGVIRTASQ